MANLIELVKGHFTDELVERLQPFLGVDSAKAHKVADAVIPSLLGALSNKAGDEGVLGLIKSLVGDGFEFGKVWSPGGGLVSLVEKGHPMVQSLLGDHLKESVTAVAKASGVSDHEARKALNLTAPGLLGTLASSLGAGASVASLATLLDENKDAIAEQAGALGLPFDVKAAVAGLAGLAGIGAVATVDAEEPVMKVEEVKATAPVVEKKVAPKRITVGDEAKVQEAVVAPSAGLAAGVAAAVGATAAKTGEFIDSGSQKVAAFAGDGVGKVAAATPVAVSGSALGFLPGLAFLAAIAVGTFLLVKGCDVGGPVAVASNADMSQIEAPAMPTVSTEEVEAPKVETQKAEAPTPEGMTKVEIDGGVSLNAKEDGIEYKLVDFIKSDKPVDKTSWFSFDRLYFDTSKATLKPESKAQLENIVAIMKAYPKVKLKIGGYTDNQGSDASNMKLSTERAKATFNKLVGMGVSADRLAPEGYGEAQPIADNSTEAGRAKNRRIDLRVTAK